MRELQKKAGIHKIARPKARRRHQTHAPMQTTVAERCAADCHQKAAIILLDSTHHGWRCFVDLGLVE